MANKFRFTPITIIDDLPCLTCESCGHWAFGGDHEIDQCQCGKWLCHGASCRCECEWSDAEREEFEADIWADLELNFRREA